MIVTSGRIASASNYRCLLGYPDFLTAIHMSAVEDQQNVGAHTVGRKA